jgi:hypothetical protein
MAGIHPDSDYGRRPRLAQASTKYYPRLVKRLPGAYGLNTAKLQVDDWRHERNRAHWHTASGSVGDVGGVLESEVTQAKSKY